MPQYFLRSSMEHLTFRIPELLSIGKLFDFPIRFITPEEDLQRGVIVIELDDEKHIQHILDRSILTISANELYANATNYDDLHARLQERRQLFDPDMDTSFRITVECVNNRALNKRAREIINSFAWTGLRGKIELENPDVEFVVLEDYDFVTIHTKDERLKRDGKFEHVYFGKRVGVSRARPLINVHDIKKRAFFGNTSMEAEMGLLTAGQTLPAPGKIMYDPFVGTGSLLYAVAHWGSYVLGSDIDARQFRGKQKGKDVTPGILRSAEQYGVRDKFIDTPCFDVTQGPWRRGGWLDAIVTDPPYGVRAGAKRTGKSATRKRNQLRDEPFMLPDGTWSHEKEGYLPPSKAYELVDLAQDLVQLARYMLVPGGRLVFFLPTISDEFEHVDVPVVEGMREVKFGDGSVQDFGRWGRRLITMEKTAQDDGPPPTFGDHSDLIGEDRIPAHHQFAKRYFEKPERPEKPQWTAPGAALKADTVEAVTAETEKLAV
ncbi:hypothetical protein A1Q2_04278 [Trichosporon asahii var. asahii CBS 8904]|uniref:tRNA (guanine(10)-N(2))-methyltransferase n=1 Tax=Trichosporon asahii var. asahii (strain CBS 8904) TaxID=1220162 RepID=K1VKZ8_TRIAC|nr:hypothetical protein A1Q2_04278 [Trichosporon asahii var. asahii CBS 8904]